MNSLRSWRAGLMLLSAFLHRRGPGSHGPVLLAEHLLHCHHRLGSLLPLQLLHCGESRPCLQPGTACALGPHSFEGRDLFLTLSRHWLLAICAKSPRQHRATPFLKRFIRPGGSSVVLMGSDSPIPSPGAVPHSHQSSKLTLCFCFISRAAQI